MVIGFFIQITIDFCCNTSLLYIERMVFIRIPCENVYVWACDVELAAEKGKDRLEYSECDELSIR